MRLLSHLAFLLVLAVHVLLASYIVVVVGKSAFPLWPVLLFLLLYCIAVGDILRCYKSTYRLSFRVKRSGSETAKVMAANILSIPDEAMRKDELKKLKQGNLHLYNEVRSVMESSKG